jgi:superfamily II DNA or RNA helicase
MAQTLRRYQNDAVDAVMRAIDPFNDDQITRALYTAATASGKTTIFAELVRRLVQHDHKVLVLAHRIELIEQAVKRITNHCKGVLTEFDIQSEANIWKAAPNARVIVGMVQTCCRPHRPTPEWRPTVIITDEAAHAAAKMQYQSIYTRYGVDKGECIHIGCTATPRRTDRQSLYAENTDGTPVMLAQKKGAPPKPADPKQSVYQRLVYDYSILDAVEDGWIVEPHIFRVESDTDISQVRTVAGDFAEKDLAKAVDNDRRTNLAISAWKKIAADQPTIVFCVNVEHAAHAAAAWRDAGYTARDVNGETDSDIRHDIFEAFKRGDLQVITNCAIATEGTDLPNCGSIVCLRPTKSWALYVQQIGRGSRPLDGLLNGMEEAHPEFRLDVIARSAKPKNLVIDVVDICKDIDDLCTGPAILDLPVGLDLEGHGVAETKRLLDEHKEAEEIARAEMPATFTELKGTLVAVDLLRKAGARSKAQWKILDSGTCRYTGVPPGYDATLHRHHDRFQLRVTNGHGTLYDKTGKSMAELCGGDEGKAFDAYLDKAAEHAAQAIQAHQETLPKGTLGKLAAYNPKFLGALRAQRDEHRNRLYTDEAIDRMNLGWAKKLAIKHIQEYHARQKQTA